MKNRSFFIFSILIFSVFFSYQTAFATVLVGQNDYSTSQLGSNDGVGRFQTWQGMGTGFSGVADSLRIKITGTIGSGPAYLYLFCYNDSSYTTPCTGDNYWQTIESGTNSQINTLYDTGTDFLTFPLTGVLQKNNTGSYNQTLTFNATKYYAFTVYCNNLGADIHSYGSASTTIYGNEAENGVGGSHTTAFYSFGFEVADSGGYTPLDVSTRIQDITPADGAITGSTSVVVSANYYFNDPDVSNYLTPPLVLVARLHRTDGIGSPDQSFDFTPLIYNSLNAVSHTFTLPTNTIWELRWDISGDGYYFISPFSSPVSFNVVSDPTTGSTGYTTCSITDLAGCFQNALVYLFYPSSASLNQFNGLYNEFVDKPPFGYIVAIQNALKGINDTSTSIFTLQSMPILNTYIFNPIYIALEWVLWVAFAFVLYHRLKNIQL